MSQNTKKLLAIAAGTLLALALCMGTAIWSLGGLAWNGLTQAVEFDDEQVAMQAGAIARFQLPAGYAPDYSFGGAGFSLVAYDPGDNHSHLIFVQAPKWLRLDQSQFEQQLRRNFGDQLQWGQNDETVIVEHRTLRVAGEPVEFAIGEGVNGDGDPYRSMAGVWESPNGQVLIYIEEPLSRWNQAEIDAFVATIEG